jgi:RNA polymerase sigma-70 factor (ECF subfamily)
VADSDSDVAALTRLQAGDESAFRSLVERYHTRLVRFAGSYVSRNDLAEDVAQETWIAVLRGVDRFEGRSSFATWLFQICANRARSIAQREHRTIPAADVSVLSDRPVFSADGSWAAPPDAWSAEVEAMADDAALLVAVHEAILGLPSAQRQVITLRDVEGLTAQEACDVMMISSVNQRVLLHRARLQVRTVLASAMTR